MPAAPYLYDSVWRWTHLFFALFALALGGAFFRVAPHGTLRLVAWAATAACGVVLYKAVAVRRLERALFVDRYVN